MKNKGIIGRAFFCFFLSLVLLVSSSFAWAEEGFEWDVEEEVLLEEQSSLEQGSLENPFSLEGLDFFGEEGFATLVFQEEDLDEEPFEEGALAEVGAEEGFLAESLAFSLEGQDAGEVSVNFAEDQVSVSKETEGLSVSGGKVTISSPGTYVFSGACSDGCIEVAKGTGEVIIALNGLTLTAKAEGTVPINAKSGNVVTLLVYEGTTNVLSDADHGGEKPKSCVNAGGSLTLMGSGELFVNGHNKNGIKADEELLIREGVNLHVNAVDHGIAADTSLIIEGGSIEVTSGGDGIRSCPDTLAEDGSNGNVTIQGGSFHLVTAGDALQADQALTISGGEFSVVSGGGSSIDLAEDADSCKGLKGEKGLTITGGSFSLNCADDAIHSDGDIRITGGKMQIASGDDAVHADGDLSVGTQSGADDGVVIEISTCTEGLEGYRVNVYSGTVSLTSTDDGMNASGDEESTGSREDGYAINILGGKVFVNAEGDGLDSNGNITISGGTVVVYGAASDGPHADNSALDYDGVCRLEGGTLFAAGARGMGRTTFSGSQKAVTFQGKTFRAGDYIHVLDANQKVVFVDQAVKTVNTIIYSAPSLGTSIGYLGKVVEEALPLGTVTEADGTGSQGDQGGPGGQWGEVPGRPGWPTWPSVTPTPTPAPTNTPVPTPTPTPAPAARVELNVSTLKMQVGTYTKKVAITYQEAGDTIKSWKSSDKSVAVVTKAGTIKAKGEGKCKVTLTMASGAKAKITVKVQTDPVPAKSLTVSAEGLSGKKLTLEKGSTVKLAVSLSPFTASTELTFSSSNTKVASVSAKGKVKAKKKGSAKITITCGNASLVLKVKVQ